MLQLKHITSLNLDGYTVVLPAICVGNAAQLACDLIISSKSLKRVGNIVHPALIPLYGPSAYQHEPEEKAAACEVYEGAEDKLLVIQFRSPLISKHSQSFHNELADLLQKLQPKRIIILSGSFGFEKRIIGGSSYGYRASEAFKEAHAAQFKVVGWNEFTGDVVYGGGNCIKLYKLLEERSVPVMVLFRYLLDGDASMQATVILRELNLICKDFLQISGKDDELKLVVPVSWKLLFGNEFAEIC
ncbi:proteasome assembly chaperone 2 [Teleopsis dalmanni]|uniref:proteasome assembly chaperone 2 n=1 Tax=Teleopsis dalmanni TaxID=139649 RepID=UPI0018CCDDA7|nr:proteasome assembly chaperone 2 [Teleopsis dalmanni]